MVVEQFDKGDCGQVFMMRSSTSFREFAIRTMQEILIMNDNVIIWDNETIPDLQGFAAANYLTGKTDAQIREVMGDKFPKHIYHSIVCIGALFAHQSKVAEGVGFELFLRFA